ncbi:ABC transporter substrate-binding protein [Phyllobacterium sp. LjRoot231]|uniref:ABC transporter substrate-binding protein n=1 Tax=Phyllobacterium sp. LjRoot231 TaxID=3342289 RepID=UPI003ECF74D6
MRAICDRGPVSWQIAPRSRPDRWGWSRRLCLDLVGASSVLVWVFGVSQPFAAETPRIGILTYGSCDPVVYRSEFSSFLSGLEELGYKEGETVSIECRSADRQYDKLRNAADELVRIPVDVIVTGSQPSGRAAQEATHQIPIVSVVSGDPISAGFARSLAKPGGNFTGVSYYATELTAKRMELLKEAIPGIARVGVLVNPDLSYLPFEADARRAAGRLNIAIAVYQARQPADLDRAFSEMKRDGVQAVFVLPDVMFAYEAERIAALAIENRLPEMAWGVWFAQAGSLMAYSADYDEMNRRLAFYVDRILKGAKPGDLPMEQPTTFRLTVNLKTAKTLGLELPPTILTLADEVIE